MVSTASWVEGRSVPVEPATLSDFVTAAANDAAEGRPLVVAVRAEGAEVTFVVGDQSGTTLVYFPPDYDGVGSLHSVADREAADADRWEPPLVAYYFTHYTEFPRWSVVPNSLGQQAVQEFLGAPSEPPRSIMCGTGLTSPPSGVIDEHWRTRVRCHLVHGVAR